MDFFRRWKLCATCRKLAIYKDLESVYEHFESMKQNKGPKFFNNWDNGPACFKHASWKKLSISSGCPLCIFFQKMIPESSQTAISESKSDTGCELLAIGSAWTWLFQRTKLEESKMWETSDHTVFLTVIPNPENVTSTYHDEAWLKETITPSGLIYLSGPDNSSNNKTLFRVRELSDQINFNIVKEEWLSFCSKHHGSTCKPDLSEASVSSGFRVIDCHLNPPQERLKPWGFRYVVLSYVWGRSEEDLVPWPKTVLDAVAVTKELGYQYLWVDRRCINQFDAKEKAYLISQMGTIYAMADLTIIAAAGNGASAGLPGVRATSRKPQPKFKLKRGHMLISTLEDPQLEIARSEWYTRGWTYQEAILSKRRLVFTEHQMYWECPCMTARESIDLPLELVHNDSKSRMADFMLGGIFKGVSSISEETTTSSTSRLLSFGFPDPKEKDMSILGALKGLEHHIETFSKRKLTNGDDSLSAFIGIVGLFDSSVIGILLGMPFRVRALHAGYPRPDITFALALCSWYHRNSTESETFVSESCQRRCHLPSWTWAGWQGTVTWRLPPADEYCSMVAGLIGASDIEFFWVTDICLQDSATLESVRIEEVKLSPNPLDKTFKVIEFKDPLILDDFNFQIGKKYTFAQKTSPHGDWVKPQNRELRHMTTDRVAFVATGESMTLEKWSQDHASRELVSVLVYAGFSQNFRTGRARFITIRKVQSPDTDALTWERIGIIQLEIPTEDLMKYQTNERFLEALPVTRREGSIQIQ